MARALRDGKEYHGQEIILERPDGARRIVVAYANPFYDEVGTLCGAVNVLVDITERKLAQQRVRELLAREQVQSGQLRAAATAALAIHAATTCESVVRTVTEEARRLLATHQAQSRLGADPHRAEPIDCVSLSEKYARWRLGNGSPATAALEALLDRTRKPVRLTQAELEAHPELLRRSDAPQPAPRLRGLLGTCLVGRNGSSLGLICVSDKTDGGDFTADDEAILLQLATVAAVAIENARLYEHLREADRRKSEFLAMLAHELRNPLAPLRNGLQIIRLANDDARAVEKAQGMMDRQLGHMVRLIDDLLDLSRITNGKIELCKERIDLAAAVHDALETSRPLIEERGHKLTVTLPPEPLYVDADPTRLAQVFANLVNNSAKYTQRGGQIWLTAERVGSEVVVRVQDNGIGIPADILPKVFDIFRQANRSIERSQGGLGIGLSLVRGLVELHGGRVEAQSAGEGQGSELVVRLPVLLSPTGPPEQDIDADDGHAGASRFRILVVDDNHDSAISLALMLKIMGHQTQTAHDGLEAVERAAQFRPDVMLLDIGLPKLNGYDACRRIRQEPWGQRMALIALTGWGQEEDKRRSKEAGFNYHMVKPVDPAAIEDLLRGLLLAPA